MTKINRITAIVLALIMICAIFASCGSDAEKEKGLTTSAPAETESKTTAPATSEAAKSETESGTEAAKTEPTVPVEHTGVKVRLGGLKGPTSMGMAKLIDDAGKGLTENAYEYTMATTADELTPLLLKGELDILAAPVNLASVLYNKSGGKVKFAAVNTLGVLYIVEKGGDTIHSLADLKGKTLYATGKGTTPEFALNYLLSEVGIDMSKDLNVEWKSEPTEIVSLMATMESAYAMMPQPFVTVAQTKLDDLHIALDLTKEWDSLTLNSRLITAGFIVRSEFAENEPEALSKFLKEYEASVRYVNDNHAEASVLVENLDIVKAQIAEKAIEYCNLVCITGEQMKKAVSGYLDVLYKQKPDSVGGSLPGDDFYIIPQ